MQEQFQSDRLSDEERRLVDESLHAILSTDKFLAAPQMSAFLRYVVEESVAGNQSRIKAFTVAVDALGKPEDFDPQNDPVVRVLAGRLRTALDNYYQDNPNAALFIKMKRGSYIPSFLPADSHEKLTDEVEYSADTAALAATQRHDSNPLTSTDWTRNDHRNPTTMPHRVAAGTDDLREASTHFDVSSDSQSSAHSATKPVIQPSLIGYLSTYPKSLLLVVVGALVVAITMLKATSDNPLPQQSASAVASSDSVPMQSLSSRPRPSHVSVFVSAVQQDNALENNLNTVLSGAISENQSIRVYRILQDHAVPNYWPEDYILAVDAMALPEETRIDLQLIEAQTGRISHSQSIQLDVNAHDGLSNRDLSQVIAVSQNLVKPDGPLFLDYTQKSK